MERISIPVGNEKLGRIPSFSLMGGVTCPGKTVWCWEQQNCYNCLLKKRWPHYGVALERNTRIARHIPTLKKQLQEFFNTTTKTIFRLHVDGDFHTVAYIRMWDEIIQQYPHIKFFGFTKSWSVPRLVPALTLLRQNTNLQLFNSVDITTKGKPPKNQRIAYVEHVPEKSGLVCPEMRGKVKNCTDCGYCFQHTKGNIIFLDHSPSGNAKRRWAKRYTMQHKNQIPLDM